MRGPAAALLAAATLALALTACAATPSPPPPPATSDLLVFAASSLAGPFDQLGREFEAAHPGVRVRFSFDGSASLLDQLAQGAPAHVFASADRPTMDAAVAAGLVAGTPEPFATNHLTLIVAPGNPAGITGLDDSLRGRKLVVCAARVPCGASTATLAGRLGVTLQPASEETKATDVRTKVESGQADAGVVYVTDAAAAAERVDEVPIEGAADVRNEYLIGVVAEAQNSTHPDDNPTATSFLAFVTGTRGRAVLDAAGFQ